MIRLALIAICAAGLAYLVISVPAADAAAPPDAAQHPETESSPQRWEKQIRAMEERMVLHPAAPNGVVFAGSSSIRLWNLAESFANMPASNQGFGGSEISDSVHFYPRIIAPLRPSVIVLYAGDNDIARGKTADTVLQDFRSFVDTARMTDRNASILFISIKPSLSRWKLAPEMNRANSLIEDYCRQADGLRYVNVWDPMLGADGQPRGELFLKDGLHLNAEGYQLWTSILTPELLAASESVSR
jgi:lysophospholipase L1-like esterase